MTKSYATKPTLMLKLDFKKAFDCIEHPYIWAMLEKIGFGDTFLMLVKGLLAGEISKVHVNGWFTKEIPMTHGVKQGDPLSPLLFALTMQPLMEYLQYKLTTKDMEGI